MCADIDANIPTVAHVSWTSGEPAAARVSTLDGSGQIEQSTSWSDESGLEHRVHVVALEPDSTHVPELGDAIWTPDGNLVGSWTSLGLIEEYDDQVQPLWSLSLELGFYGGRISWLETLEP